MAIRFQARYQGTCFWCGGEIHPGDEISRSLNGWRHVHCPDRSPAQRPLSWGKPANPEPPTAPSVAKSRRCQPRPERVRG